jgi:hypothetical protein
LGFIIHLSFVTKRRTFNKHKLQYDKLNAAVCTVCCNKYCSVMEATMYIYTNPANMCKTGGFPSCKSDRDDQILLRYQLYKIVDKKVYAHG